MDAVIFIIIALIFVSNTQQVNKQAVDTVEEAPLSNPNRTARLNDTFYRDEHAFCEIANALGFPKEL